jgi:hypothetical protein
MMNILFISYAAISLSKKGGVRPSVMVRALADAGHQIDLAVLSSTLPDHPNIRLLTGERGGSSSRNKLRMVCLHATGRVSYDAVHVVDEAVFFAARLCRWKKIPLVYDAGRCFGGKAGTRASGLWKLFPKYVSKMEARVLEQASTILSPCTTLTKNLIGIDPNSKVVQLEDIPIQPLCTRQEIERTSLLERFGKRPESVVVCSVLSGHTIGLRTLLMAARKVIKAMPSTAFFFSGIMHEQAGEMAANLDISDHCIFLSADDVETFLSALGIADASLLIPQTGSRYIQPEVYTLLHANAPLVAIQNTAYDEILTEKTSVRVLPNPDSIAEGLLRVIQEPLFSLAVVHEGQQLVADRHTYSSFKHKIRMIYHQLSKQG